MLAIIALTGAALIATPSPAPANPRTLLEDLVPRPSAELIVGMDVYTIAPRIRDVAVESLGGHRHPGRMYVYVLDGEVRSKLDDAPAADFTQGQAWMEQPGQLHRIVNVSKERPARLLVMRLEPAPSR